MESLNIRFMHLEVTLSSRRRQINQSARYKGSRLTHVSYRPVRKLLYDLKIRELLNLSGSTFIKVYELLGLR